VPVPWYPTRHADQPHVQQDARPPPSPRHFPKFNHYPFFFFISFFFFFNFAPLPLLQKTKKRSIPSLSRPRTRAVNTALHHQQYPKTCSQPAAYRLAIEAEYTPNKCKPFPRKSWLWVSPFVPRSRAPQRTRKEKRVARKETTPTSPVRVQALSFFLPPPP